MGTIVVTGGAGFIGSHTCEALLKRGDHVICIDKLDGTLYDSEYKLKNLEILKNSKFTFEKADITDKAALDLIFSRHRVDGIIHIAALAGVRPSVENPLLYENVNVRGTLHLLEACRHHNIKKFIFASSSSVYGEKNKPPFKETDNTDHPASPYAATKKSAELLCATYSHLFDIRCSCLRFFTVYGPRGRPDMATWKFTEGILTKPPVVVFGNGDIKRDFTFVTDIVSGIIAALDLAPKYEIFNLGAGRPISMNELIKIVETTTGKKAQVEYRPGKLEDVPITHADIRKAKEVLSYTPHVSVEEGVRRFVEWYRSR